MGLLSNAFNVVKNSVVGKALDVLTVSIAHPVKTIEAVISPKITVNDVIKDSFSKPLLSQISSTVLGTAAIAGTIVAGAAVGTAAKAGTLVPAIANAAKSLIPTTVKGKAVAAVSTLALGGAIAAQPAATAKAIIQTPISIANFGGNVATFAANPSISNAKAIVTENPVIASGVAIGAALTVGSAVTGVLSTISTKQNTKAVLENTKAMSTSETLPSTPVVSTSTSGKVASPEVIYASDAVVPKSTTSSLVPVTPQTTTVSSGKTTKVKRRSRARSYQNINQRVNVMVNSMNTKRYLNTVMLKH